MKSSEKEIYSDFYELIKLIDSKPKIPEAKNRTNIFFISDQIDGTLILDFYSADLYKHLLTKIFNFYSKTEEISRQYIQSQMNLALLSALNETKSPDMSLEEKIQTSFKIFITSLNKPKAKCIIYYPVFGLRNEGLPFEINNISLVIFNEENLRDLNIISSSSDSEQEKIYKEIEIEHIKNDGVIGSTYAVIEMYAVDSKAASQLALKKLKSFIEILNFFVSLIPFPNGFIYLPGDSNRLLVFNPIKSSENKKEILLGREVVGPLSPISLKSILDFENDYGIGFSRIVKKIEEPCDDLETLIINSCRWAGKAFVFNMEGKKEDAFLSYFIALESIILPKQNTELVFRFTVRLTHLISLNKEHREEISKTIKNLYEIRSKIVHSGKFEIIDSDVATIKLFTKSALLRLLTEEPFNNMNKIEELENWFDKQIFGN